MTLEQDHSVEHQNRMDGLEQKYSGVIPMQHFRGQRTFVLLSPKLSIVKMGG